MSVTEQRLQRARGDGLLMLITRGHSAGLPTLTFFAIATRILGAALQPRCHPAGVLTVMTPL